MSDQTAAGTSPDDETPSTADAQQYGTTRLEAFSDGVFAIAITLLVLEISVPAGSEDHLLQAVLDQWPSYLGYLVSFATIGAIWLGHNAITHYLDHTDVWLLRLNLLLLFAVAFLPFPTRLMAESMAVTSAERVAATLYGVTLLVCVLLLSALWLHARRADLLSTSARSLEIATLTRRLTPGVAGYVVMILVGLLAPLAAVVGYLLVSLFLLLPLRREGRRRRTGRRG